MYKLTLGQSHNPNEAYIHITHYQHMYRCTVSLSCVPIKCIRFAKLNNRPSRLFVYMHTCVFVCTYNPMRIVRRICTHAYINYSKRYVGLQNVYCMTHMEWSVNQSVHACARKLHTSSCVDRFRSMKWGALHSRESNVRFEFQPHLWCLLINVWQRWCRRWRPTKIRINSRSSVKMACAMV